MALGGGKWLLQNKIIPGAYINVISKGLASVRLSDRGVATIPVELDWGVDGELFKVESGDFFTDSTEIFGYDFTHEKLIFIREIFKNAETVYFYRINGGGVKAENSLATAKHSGIRGNDLSIIVSNDVDNEELKVVETLLDLRVVDVQKVKTASELEDNLYVDWKSDASLLETASTPLTGGTNLEDVSGVEYQEYLDKIDSVPFNTLGCPSNDDLIKDLFVAFTKRMRDEIGAFFQTVIFDNQNRYDHEGIITLANECLDFNGQHPAAGVYWATGGQAGVEVNKSMTNDLYDGELTFDLDHKQSEIEELIEDGRFILHNVGEEVRVLLDINNFTSFSPDKQEAFKNNQVIRIIDMKGLTLANLFNDKYNGDIPNDTAGRESFWSDIVDINRQLEGIRAIQDYNSDELEVYEGKHDGAVVVNDPFVPVTVMTHLYATFILKD